MKRCALIVARPEGAASFGIRICTGCSRALVFAARTVRK
jgi:hypothetical protein